MLGYTVSEVRIVTSRNRLLRHVSQMTVGEKEAKREHDWDGAQSLGCWLSVHGLLCTTRLLTLDVEEEINN